MVAVWESRGSRRKMGPNAIPSARLPVLELASCYDFTQHNTLRVTTTTTTAKVPDGIGRLNPHERGVCIGRTNQSSNGSSQYVDNRFIGRWTM